MEGITSNRKILTGLMFRLLPIQILLAAIGAVNGIVSTYFASNFVGVDAMTAVGIYWPVNTLVATTATVLTGGASILCGKYLGQNEQGKMHNVYTLDIILAGAIGTLLSLILVFLAFTDNTGFLTHNDQVRALLNRYITGQAIGIIPFMIGSQFTIFLSMENRNRRAMTASIAFIIANLLFNFLFVKVLGLEAFGLALASSAGMWVFFAVQAGHFLSRKSEMRFRLKEIVWAECIAIIAIGFPGAATNIYQAFRGLIVNKLLEAYVGGAGISAFTACNNFLGVFWAIPAGFVAVSRMMISVSVGEEDRQTLMDVMRVMFSRFVPLMAAISAVIMMLAVPETRIFYKDPSNPVFMMTVWGFRLLPVCMVLAIPAMHFTCYGQASGKHVLVHIVSLMDGIICVCAFSALLIPAIGMNGLYYANILNGVVILLIYFIYACVKNGKIPSDMFELMVIPRDFGVSPDERLDLTVRSMEEVVTISQKIQNFCTEKGIDNRRSYLAGLATEEMAGNIVEHGFAGDNRAHSIDVRVVHKGDDIILRLRDDCRPFDPVTMNRIAEGDDAGANIGLKMIFGILKDVEYQNILGMNVLTMKI